MIALYAMIGALLYAVRGDWLIRTGSTQVARLVWCVPTAFVVAANAGDWRAFVAALAALYVGLLCRHAHVMSVGAPMPRPAKGWRGDWLTPWIGPEQPSPVMASVTLAWIGLYRGGLVGLAMAPWAADAWIVPLTWAACHPVAYWIGWRLPVQRPHGGELLTGAVVWVAIATAAGV